MTKQGGFTSTVTKKGNKKKEKYNLSEKPNVSFDDYRAALVKNEALQTEITQLKDQLKDATDALTIVKAKFDVAEKDSLVTSLVRDGNGKLSRENLDKMTLAELYIFKDAIEKSQPKTFISVMRDVQEVKTKPKTQGTVGSYNQDTGKYEGGL